MKVCSRDGAILRWQGAESAPQPHLQELHVYCQLLDKISPQSFWYSDGGSGVCKCACMCVFAGGQIEDLVSAR